MQRFAPEEVDQPEPRVRVVKGTERLASRHRVQGAQGKAVPEKCPAELARQHPCALARPLPDARGIRDLAGPLLESEQDGFFFSR